MGERKNHPGPNTHTALADQFHAESVLWAGEAERVKGRDQADAAMRSHVWGVAEDRLREMLRHAPADPIRIGWERDVLARFIVDGPPTGESVDFIAALSAAMIATRDGGPRG